MSDRPLRITGPGRAAARVASLRPAEGHTSTLHWCGSCNAARVAPAWIRDIPGGCLAELHCPDCDVRVFGQFGVEQAAELHVIDREHAHRLQRLADQMQEASAPDWARGIFRRLRDDIHADDITG